MKRPTPETDAKWQELCCSKLSWYHIAENIKALCQEKERERDEAREAAAKWESSSDTLRTDAYQYADYILNHYDRNSHMDKLCLARLLVENGYGSKAAGWEEAK